MSVVTCREVLEYYETSYIGEYHFVLLNIFIVMNKSYKTKNYMLHWCVYFIV